MSFMKVVVAGLAVVTLVGVGRCGSGDVSDFLEMDMISDNQTVGKADGLDPLDLAAGDKDLESLEDLSSDLLDDGTATPDLVTPLDVTGTDSEVPQDVLDPDEASSPDLPDLEEDLNESDSSTPEDLVPQDTTGQCAPTAPTAPQTLPCLVWSCTQVAWPDCWNCLFDSGPAGDSCTLPDGQTGVCGGGMCLTILDTGANGASGHSTASTELNLPGGLFGTNIPLQVYLPDSDGPHPVVVFHHGFQLSPENYASYGIHLASWGFVVVMPEMPSGLLGIGAPSHVELKEYLKSILDWIAEDTAAGSGGVLKGKADVGRIGLAGHSMGGKISLLLATEDSRPLAVFGVDPVDAAGSPLPVSETDYPSVTPELMGLISVPVVLLGETVNGTCSGFMCQACAPEEDNFHQYYLYAESPALEIEVVNANHMSFLDNPDCGLACSVCPAGSDDTGVTRMLTQRYMTAFFMRELAGRPEFEVWLKGTGMAQDVADGLVLTQNKNGF